MLSDVKALSAYLRGIETVAKIAMYTTAFSRLSAYLRGIETRQPVRFTDKETGLSAYLRGIETRLGRLILPFFLCYQRT